MKKISVPVSSDSLSRIYALLDSEISGYASQDAADIRVIADEIFSNIVRHSGADELAVSAETVPHRLILTFTDNGVPFDPTAHRRENPEITVGGYGIICLMNLADTVRYVRENGYNILTVAKNLEP